MDFLKKKAFSIKDRVICVYHSKRKSKKYEYPKTQLSQYIIEITDHYKLPLWIDGWDYTRQQCFNKGGYANNAIHWDGTRD